MPVIHRSQALYWLIGGRRLVSVAGAHGKTTSTGMIVTALRALGEDPSFVNGGVIAELGRQRARGSDELFVVEADESDGSFLLYDTSIALITNVDPDHLDHYGTDDAFVEAFVDVRDRASELVVISADDAGARAVAARLIASERSSRSARRMPPTCACTGIATDGPVSFAIDHEGARSRAARASPARTTPSTPPARSPCSSGSGYDLEASLPASSASPAPDAASSCTASGAASASSTTTRTTRPRSPRRWSAARTVVGDGRIIAVHQPHTYCRTQTMSASSPRCSSATPTRRSCSTCTARARIRCPA